jgi:hypothetical protein
MRKFCFLVGVWLFVSHAQAQDLQGVNSPPPYLSTQKKYTFAIQPFQWFNSCLRFDFEMRLGDGPGWLQFGPTIYYADNKVNNLTHFYEGRNYYWEIGYYPWHSEPLAKLKGGGLDVNYKRFLNPRRSFYMASGLSYTYFDINYYGVTGTWNDYIEDGLLYHEYTRKVGYHSQHINRVSINHYFGFQPPTRSAFLFDLFWGLSYRHCFMDKDKPSFDRSPFSYGYSGPAFMMGIRFGFGIK